MRVVIADYAIEVQFALRLLDRAAIHAHHPNYPGVNRALEERWWSSNHSNILKTPPLKWTKISCVVPAFPLGP